MNDPGCDSTSTFFYWKDIALEQDDRVWKAGTDAILLGTWIPKIIHDARSILDAGTGSGILTLMMASSFTGARLTGIDHHLPAFELASRNAERSPWNERIQIEYGSLEDFTKISKTKFDLVISNPPFFIDQVKSSGEQRLVSKHSTMHPKSWMKHIKNVLGEQGSVCLVLPPIELKEWILAANDLELYVSRRLGVYSFENDPKPKRVLVQLTNSLGKMKTEQLTMYAAENAYSSMYAAWLQA